MNACLGRTSLLKNKEGSPYDLGAAENLVLRNYLVCKEPIGRGQRRCSEGSLARTEGYGLHGLR